MPAHHRRSKFEAPSTRFVTLAFKQEHGGWRRDEADECLRGIRYLAGRDGTSCILRAVRDLSPQGTDIFKGRRTHEFGGLADLDFDFTLLNRVFDLLEGPKPDLRFQSLSNANLFEQRSGENSRRRSG